MRLGAISLLTIVALVAVAASAAAWNAASSGAAAAKARTLVGAQPTLTKSGISVSVSWAATTGATGYRITRTGGVGSLGGTCTGTVTSTSCSDTPVLPFQTYTYTVTPVAGSWTGTAGPGATITT